MTRTAWDYWASIVHDAEEEARQRAIWVAQEIHPISQAARQDDAWRAEVRARRDYIFRCIFGRAARVRSVSSCA